MTPERWRHITGVFHAALERRSTDRPQFLDEACKDDDRLRAEVEAMLAAHDQAGDAAHVPALDGTTELLGLEIGSMLGPYRIEGLIGAGGMGQVYRARDPRIPRDVAIKVLAADAAGDPERLRRFEQEARASGALNHPNVVTLYDIGQSEGRPYLVTELLDGETLRERVARGALPPQRACETAAAIAHGLAAAHAKGIVHRDLKPENVNVTRDGRVKILDFGIAKLRSPNGDTGRRTMSATRLTAEHTILGTVGYMAPEQIRGQHTDERADIFALGAILFELLTGRRAFDRSSRVETLNAILHDDPAWPGDTALDVPPTLGRIARRCLEKDADARFQSARDLAFALETSIGAPGSMPAATVPASASVSPRSRWGAIAAVALAVVALIGVAVWMRPRTQAPAMRDLARFLLTPPPGMRFLGPPAVSPDGTLIVFAAGEGPVEKQQLLVRHIDQLTVTPLPGTEGGNMPFFSPDGKWVGFWADNQLKKVSVDATTSPVVLCPVELFLGGTWSSDGTIVFGSINHALQRVVADGGIAQPLTTLDRAKSEVDHHAPKFLPGNRALLFTVHEGGERFRIDVLTLATGARRTVVPSAFDAQYSPTGHLVYGAGTDLFAVPFDLDRAAVAGSPVKLVDGIGSTPQNGDASFALSATGTMIMRPQPPPARRTLAWADRSGITTPLPVEPRKYWTPRLSPDGKQFAVVVEDRGQFDIWVYRFDSKVFDRLTVGGRSRSPVWAGDSVRLSYLSERDGVRHLVWQPTGRNAPSESLLSSQNDDLFPGSWSPDGRSLVYVDSPPSSDSDVHLLRIDARETSAVPGIPFRSNYPTLSPDGRWLAFVAWPAGSFGRPAIYVQPFPGAGQPRQLVDAAGQPVWSRDGASLFFRTRRGGGSTPGEGIFELPFDRARGVAAGPEQQLFRKRFEETGPSLGVSGFDVAADGRFLIIIADDSEAPGGFMNVFLHVDDELRRRMRQ